MASSNVFYEKGIKRILDAGFSALGLLVLSPVMLATAILVKKNLGSPVIFCQPRPGRDGKVFNLYKFRTMKDARDANGELLPDEVRLTAFGKALRSTSLDELPELWNILKGDMSLVGPRPLLVQYLPRYNDEQRRRHDVRPGLTGWAQVNGRNNITWEEKFQHDVWYVDHVSLLLDARILMMTVGKILRREGISAEGSATMEEFMGTGERNNG